MSVVYFQTKKMNKKYCEVGMFLDSDPDYIHYLDEPCKIHISEVKIIDKKNVRFDKKKRTYCVINSNYENN